MARDDTDQALRPNPAPGADALELIRQSLSRIRFGAIQLTVHEGKLVQIDITEKRRFPA